LTTLERLNTELMLSGEKQIRVREQKAILDARQMLAEGILHDLGRIEGGAEMPALGEGLACEFCAARGLCRRDWWA